MMVSKKKPKLERGLRRTFTGCWSCRSRGVKCDEKLPSCSRCLNYGSECAGYRQNLVWVDSEDFKRYRPGGRRLLELETWKSYPAPDHSAVDDIIAKCELKPDDIDISVVSWPPFGVFRCSNIFISNSAETHGRPNDTLTVNDIEVHDDAEVNDDVEEVIPHILPMSLRPDNRLRVQDVHIFHHYVRDVAPQLMPFPDPRNPWSNYPAMALQYSGEGQKCLFNALMAHSAVSLANKGEDRNNMLVASTRFYLLAIKELQEVIGRKKVDYVGLLTTIMTLMFTEMYLGNSTTWRPHMNGAWQLMLQQKDLQMWSISDQAWYATQSFCLIKIVSETTGVRQKSSQIEDFIMECLLSSNLFGITMGASRSLMRCISDINKLSQVQESSIDPLLREINIASILQRLENCRASDLVSADSIDEDDPVTARGHILGTVHMRAFIAAAFIYYYQQFYDLPPSSLAAYVSEVLENLQLFLAAGGVNFTFWPAFIAASEVYTEDAKSFVIEIFSFTSLSSFQNRDKVMGLLKKVWSVRETRSAESGLDQGLIKIDWRSVMKDLDLDILLM